MSLILIKTDQEHYDPQIMTFSALFKTYGFLIDVSSNHELKQKRNLALALLEKQQDHPAFISNIKTKSVLYEEGCLFVINFSSPLIRTQHIQKYQQYLLATFEELSPCLVHDDIVAKIEGASIDQMHKVLTDIGNELFKVPRERALIGEGVKEAKDKKDVVSPSKKKI